MKFALAVLIVLLSASFMTHSGTARAEETANGPEPKQKREYRTHLAEAKRLLQSARASDDYGDWRRVLDEAEAAMACRYAGIQEVIPIAEEARKHLPVIYENWPYDSREAERQQAETAKRMGVPVERIVVLGKTVRMRFVLIPAGCYLMGSRDAPDEMARLTGKSANLFAGNRPRHMVRITRPFYLAETECTRDQWEAVTGVLPSVQGRSGTDPVERVSWHDVNKLFLPKLQTYAPEGMVFKLPTEAQWEYACRAGTATRFWFGDDFGMLHQYGNYADVSYGRRKSAEAGVWDKHHDDGFESAAPVGRFPANPWGLNDMHGNVEEWCEDALYGYFYSLRDRDDPVLRAEALPLAVFRGGGWTMWAGAGTSAMRGGHYKDSQLPGVGFRVAMVWLSDMQAPGEKAADTHESQADGATE